MNVSRSAKKTPLMCLCLKAESGQNQESSTMTWEDGALLGEYMTRNTGESPKGAFIIKIFAKRPGRVWYRVLRKEPDANGVHLDTIDRYFGRIGVYIIAFDADAFTAIELGDNESSELVAVLQWGDVKWSSMFNMFKNCRNAFEFPANEVPDLSNVTDMSGMFENAGSFNQPIDHWNVSHVEDMSNMFNCAESFNQPIGNWDVSNVTNMRKMFLGARLFNRPLTDWNIRDDCDIEDMFLGACITRANRPTKRERKNNAMCVTDEQRTLIIHALKMMKYAASYKGDPDSEKIEQLCDLFANRQSKE